MSAVFFKIRREISEKTSDKNYAGYVEWLCENTIKDLPFPTDYRAFDHVMNDGDVHKYAFESSIEFFSKTKKPWDDEIVDKIKTTLMDRLNAACHAPKFSKYPFAVLDNEGNPIDWDADSGSELIPFEKALPWEDFTFDDSYIEMTDDELERTEAFSGIYERGPHIRLTLGAIQRAIETNGRIRNHVLLWGDPGAAKSGVIDSIKTILPDNSYITLNVDSCTAAGFQTLVLDKMRLTGAPPIIFLEEIEKIDSDGILRPLLSLMDTRASIQKLTNRKQRSLSARILFIATANNKKYLDSMMGGYKDDYGDIQPGAISSRFVHQLYTERPSRETLKKILLREFQANPIENLPCSINAYLGRIMDLADELSITDPRKVISFLDGGLRLLDEDNEDNDPSKKSSYQNDIMRVQRIQSAQREEHRNF